MDWISDWLEQVWALLLTLGWWSVAGLLLCCAAAYLLPRKGKPADRWRDILLTAAVGTVLPMYNFAAAPLAVFILRRGQGRGTAFAFLASAALLNPACCLLAYAYMGPSLAAAYSAAAFCWRCCSEPWARAVRDRNSPGKSLLTATCVLF